MYHGNAEVFENLKEKLTTPPVLELPDIESLSVVDTDASLTALEVVLPQKKGDGRGIWYSFYLGQ